MKLVPAGPEPWTTVFTGSMSEVLIKQGLLESNGIPTNIPDLNIKVIDPFVTGANALSVKLQTPESLAEEAEEILAWRPDPVADAEPRRDPKLERLEKLGTRIRWGSITVVTAPYALLLAPEYLWSVRRLRERPRNHGWTIAAIVFAGAITLAIVGIGLRRV
jgi:hypothetical protein